MIDLRQGDCLEVMKTLPAHCVDAIITDLPYGTTSCAWDNVIPFEPMWEQARRVMKPQACFITTASQPFTSRLVVSNLDWFKYELVWRKNTTTGFPNARYIPLKNHENVVVFSPAPVRSKAGNTTMTYNPQGLVPINKTRKAGKKASAINTNLKDGYYTAEWTNFPRSVLEFQSERGYHPTQKPVTLYEWLVRTYTNPGDTVLDLCMGSGTTGLACLATGRRFIGIEQDSEYFEVSKRRIHSVIETNEDKGQVIL